MKALSVHQPYADQIAKSIKDVEYRSWNTDYRGDLLICSTKKTTKLTTKQTGYLFGYAVCVVKLIDSGRYAIIGEKYYEPINGFCWILSDIRPIKPFPVKGQQRLFDVDDRLIEYLK